MARERRVRMTGQYGWIEVARWANGNTIIEAELLSQTNPDVAPERVRMVLTPEMTGAAEDLLAALAAAAVAHRRVARHARRTALRPERVRHRRADPRQTPRLRRTDRLRFDEPIPGPGRQRLWRPPDDVVDAVNELLARQDT